MSNPIKGGEFLIRSTPASEIFIPEEWDEETLMIAQTCRDFIEQEIDPVLDRLDAMEDGLMASKLDKAAELGLLGIATPEEYGGFGKDFKTSMLTTEILGGGHSFAVAIAAHTGIGMLPIQLYGNALQRAKYLPKMITGEWKACYCLTEPGAGSDANSGKTKAVLTSDGKYYVINGQKMWITNSGFAEVFIVFAKIDEMGIKGSSTRQVFFNDCHVPVENLLSERGNGFKIAVNILNVGRLKLAGAALGGAKRVATHATKYANERHQFGRSIAKYGAIKQKIGEMAIRTYAVESALYRATQNVDDAIKALQQAGMEEAKAKLKGVEQFAAEAAILKVHGSEVLDFVVDEGVQIYGGMGYSAEAPMERAYRDSRINRIFEGTNEINRMLVVDMLLRKAMKGELDLMGPAQKVAGELMSIPDFGEPDTALFAAEKKALENFKKAVLMVAGAAVQKFMMTLAKEQEILMNIADMAIETYTAESTLLRVEKLASMRGEGACAVQLAIMRSRIYDAADRILKSGKDAVNSFAEGDEQRMMQMGLRRFTKVEPVNIKEVRRFVADYMLSTDRYNL